MGDLAFDPSPSNVAILGLALIIATPAEYVEYGVPAQYPGIAYAGASLIVGAALFALGKALKRRFAPLSRPSP